MILRIAYFHLIGVSGPCGQTTPYDSSGPLLSHQYKTAIRGQRPRDRPETPLPAAWPQRVPAALDTSRSRDPRTSCHTQQYGSSPERYPRTDVLHTAPQASQRASRVTGLSPFINADSIRVPEYHSTPGIRKSCTMPRKTPKPRLRDQYTAVHTDVTDVRLP